MKPLSWKDSNQSEDGMRCVRVMLMHFRYNESRTISLNSKAASVSSSTVRVRAPDPLLHPILNPKAKSINWLL